LKRKTINAKKVPEINLNIKYNKINALHEILFNDFTVYGLPWLWSTTDWLLGIEIASGHFMPKYYMYLNRFRSLLQESCAVWISANKRHS